MNEKPMLWAAAVIKRKDLYLIVKKKNNSFISASKWAFPSGEVKFFEHPEHSIVDIIKEKLDINISVDNFFTLNSHLHNGAKDYHIIVLTFLADWVSGEPKAIFYTDHKWVTYEELKNLDIAEENIGIAKVLLEKFRPVSFY